MQTEFKNLKNISIKLKEKALKGQGTGVAYEL